MFSIGEKVMYGGTGVCVVEEITSVKFSASQPGKPYYLLRPMYQTGTIQTPADSGKVPIRPVMNRSEAEAVIDAMPTVPAEICTEKNLSALRNYYQKQITSFDSMDLIRLAKSIRAKKIEAEKRQKRIGSTDEKYLRRAEELLFGELAVALEISMDDVPAFIEQRLGSLAAALEQLHINKKPSSSPKSLFFGDGFFSLTESPEESIIRVLKYFGGISRRGGTNTLTQDEKKQLKIAACKVRLGIIEGVYAAKSGHPGGSLSAADVLTYLYFKHMNIDPQNPRWEKRDRFVLSKGHAAPALYSVLANRGFFPVDELKTLRHIGSRLQGHPNMNLTPGVDMSTGSLGQGVSTAAGMALGAKRLGNGVRVYTLLGDGEIEEGQVWEAMMFASHYKLDNLLVFVDNNNLQIDGAVSDVMSPYPIDEKFAAFGLFVQTVDGHDFDAIDAAVKRAEQEKGRPSAIVLKTVKGKGVSFMENQVGWHGKAPNEEQYRTAMEELTAALREEEAE